MGLFRKTHFIILSFWFWVPTLLVRECGPYIGFLVLRYHFASQWVIVLDISMYSWKYILQLWTTRFHIYPLDKKLAHCFVSTTMAILRFCFTCKKIPDIHMTVWLWICKCPLEMLTILHYEIWGCVTKYVQLQICYSLYKIYSSCII